MFHYLRYRCEARGGGRLNRYERHDRETGSTGVPRLALFMLATWESLIGLGLIFGKALRATLLLLFLQMPGTISPMFFFPDLTCQHMPFVLTIEGQYIVKNLVLVSAGIVIGATARGGGLVAARPFQRPE